MRRGEPTLALSVDVEEYFHVSNFAGLIDPRRWNALPSRVGDETRRLLDLFDEQGARATFFVLGWVAERHPQLIGEIARRGHELACHGYSHELVYALGPARFRADLRRARRAIEDAAGRTPTGYRAPSYSITRRSLWALAVLAEEGFRYDSSIFPIRHPRYGIPDSERAPFAIDVGGGARLIEFPLTTARVGSWNLPVAGGAYLRLLPEPLFRWGLRRALETGGPAVLYLHPWELDPEQPRLRVDWKLRLRHYHNLERVEGRVRRLLRDHRFGTMSAVIEEHARRSPLPVRSIEEWFPEPTPLRVRRPHAGREEQIR